MPAAAVIPAPIAYIMSKDKSTSSIGIKKKINNDEVNEEDFENNYLEGEYTKKLNDNYKLSKLQ